MPFTLLSFPIQIVEGTAGGSDQNELTAFLFSIGIQCPVLTAPDHGNMTGDSFTYKDIVEFSCDVGYLLTGSAVRECLNTGDWDGSSATCKRMCIMSELCTPYGGRA